MTIDERIAAELRRHAPEVDEHAAWDRIRSSAPAHRRSRALRLVAMSAAAFGFVVLGFVLLPNLSSGPLPPSDAQSLFLDTWVNTETDGSTQTMTIQASQGEDIEILGHDDFASVCSGAPSTMTGTGRLEGTTTMIVPSPVLSCDDGSQPEAVSGSSLEEQLQNLTFVHDPQTDTLTDNHGSVWERAQAEDPSPEPTAEGGMWPQSSLEEVEEAQELADAGDPDYTWQVDPEMETRVVGEAGLVVRFLREELGWEQFVFHPYVGWDQPFSNLTFIRCAPGQTNSLYPNDETAGRCAPTIDDLRYETVELDVAQPVRSGPSGIWVVTRSEMVAPFSQVAPPTVEAATLVEDFLQARIEGEDAERYVTVRSEGAPSEVPLLYATSSGAPYERFEFERVEDPTWPFGDMEFKVRLFADGGDSVVEQAFSIPGSVGPLRLDYWAYQSNVGDAPTTENGQPLAAAFEFFDGEVTLHAAHPWVETWANFLGLIPEKGGNLEERIELVPDPLPVETGCQAGPAPADAEALARSISSNPDVVATAPVTTTVGGVEALQMDVTAAPGASVCDYFLAPPAPPNDSIRGVAVGERSRMRLYLIDVPGGSSIRTLAIAIAAPEDRFERLMEAAAPIVDSVEFHTE